MKKFFLVLSALLMCVNYNAFSQTMTQWDAQFDEIRMTKKVTTSGDYNDIITFKFGNYWPPYPFSVNLEDGDIAIFPKVKGPNDPSPIGVIWDTDWVGELWTSNRDDVSSEGRLVSTFNKDTQVIVIPKEFLFDNTQAIVRLLGVRETGNILYDQFFFSLSTTNTNNIDGGNGENGNVIIEIPCYITDISTDNFTIENSSMTLETSVTTSKIDCAWSISTTDNWIVLPAKKQYVGSSTFVFDVLENDSEEFRVGNIKVDNRNITVIQKAKAVEEVCQIGFRESNNLYDYAIFENNPSESFIEVRTSKEDCSWRASTNVDWIELSTFDVITGNSNLSFSVTLNDTQEARFGFIEILPVVDNENGPKPEKRIFAVAQRGKFVPIVEVPCYVAETIPAFSVIDYQAKQEENAIGIEVFLNKADCETNIVSQDSWITVSQKSITENDENTVEINDGSGSAVVYNTAKIYFEVEENNTQTTRVGSIKIGNDFFVVVQDSKEIIECEILGMAKNNNPVGVLARSFDTFDGQGGTGSCSVIVSGESCNWYIESASDWIDIEGFPDKDYKETRFFTGNGSLNYTIKENTTNNIRIGIIKIQANINEYREFLVVQATKKPSIKILFNGEIDVVQTDTIPMNPSIVID